MHIVVGDREEEELTLFDDWNEALIWSCLQGHMGKLVTDKEVDPQSARIVIGDFVFLAGNPYPEFFKELKRGKLLIPKDTAWEECIEEYYGNSVNKMFRYAIKKELNVFDKQRLLGYVEALDSSYELRLFDEEVFAMARKEQWAEDLCSQFQDYEDYQRRAVGVAILKNGNLVAGASPYAVYDGGIEIEIDTKPEYRRKGLATVCGAKLILECLQRNLYPSWDAHDLRSVALAEKLGYHMDFPYVTYELLGE